MTVDLSDEEAMLFLKFQEHYQVIAPIMGYMSSLKLMDISNTHIGLDIDAYGKIKHMEITKHFRDGVA